MIATLTTLLLLAVAAPFVLYPLVLWLRAAVAPDPIHAADITPSVSLIICAHDEAGAIQAKLENALQLDYPPGRLEIIVASDGSNDETVALSRRHEARGVRVLDLPRKGKAFALAQAAQASTAEILAFSDANSMWEAGALRALARPFADPRVGGVAGDQRYTDDGDSGRAVGERGYWNFDRVQKRWQTRAGNVISATGAIYAVRRECFAPPPPDATDDFMVSTAVIAQGRRLAFAEDAIALEPPAARNAGEFRRKVRVTTRGLRAVAYRRALLNPARSGSYALALLLHKVWRRLTFIPAAGLLLLAPACWSAGGLLSLLAVAVVGGTTLGLLGLSVPWLARSKPFAIPAYVLMVNAACAVASFNALRGHRVSHWEPERANSGFSGSAS